MNECVHEYVSSQDKKSSNIQRPPMSPDESGPHVGHMLVLSWSSIHPLQHLGPFWHMHRKSSSWLSVPENNMWKCVGWTYVELCVGYSAGEWDNDSEAWMRQGTVCIQARVMFNTLYYRKEKKHYSVINHTWSAVQWQHWLYLEYKLL